eukprot:scaffold32300_cov69-Phaeocystis_antarctica.AAC.7
MQLAAQTGNLNGSSAGLQLLGWGRGWLAPPVAAAILCASCKQLPKSQLGLSSYAACSCVNTSSASTRTDRSRCCETRRSGCRCSAATLYAFSSAESLSSRATHGRSLPSSAAADSANRCGHACSSELSCMSRPLPSAQRAVCGPMAARRISRSREALNNRRH